MDAAGLIQGIESAGGKLAIEGDEIVYEIPPQAKPLLEELRAQKPQVIEFLRQRRGRAIERLSVPEDRIADGAAKCPVMPRGVRLVSYQTKLAPVAVDVCSVVVDVPKFIESELCALDSRLNNPWTIHGGFTVPQILDRLAQAGLEVELEPRAGNAKAGGCV